METNELYLKTAFACMTCDGDIADEEVQLIKKIAEDAKLFDKLDVQAHLNSYISAINKEGRSFLASYLKEVSDAVLNDTDALNLIKIAIQTIEADQKIEYSEISFFKKIRKRLSITDDKILQDLPDKEDYLLPDIEEPDDLDWEVSFNEIVFNKPLS